MEKSTLFSVEDLDANEPRSLSVFLKFLFSLKIGVQMRLKSARSLS